MNSKELEAEKKLKKSKSKLKNGGQQVFVLPPNLLQKLGINLGNVETNSSSLDMECKTSTCNENEKCEDNSVDADHEINSNNIDNETSIIETASLMKESVFLSPTFNTENLNIDSSSHIGGYVDTRNAELNCATENKPNNMSEHDHLNSKKLEDKCNVSEHDKDASSHIGGYVDTRNAELNCATENKPNNMSEHDHLNSKKLEDKCNVSEHDKDASSHIGGSVDTRNAELNCATENKPNNMSEHDHLNSKKLEDKCKVSEHDKDVLIENETMSINGSTTLETISEKETKKVVNILSEETVNVAQLNELKVLQMPPSSTVMCLPASLQTLIGKSLKQNPITQTKTVTKDVIDLQIGKSNDDLISNGIEMSNTENTVNMDLKINGNPEKICNFDNNENHMSNFETKKEKSENIEEKTETCNYFDSGRNHLILDNTVIKNLNDAITEKNLGLKPDCNKLGVIDEAVGIQSMMIDKDSTDEIKPLTLNNGIQEMPTIINNPLLNNHIDVETGAVNEILEPEKECDITQNVECGLTDLIINTNNNNTWNHNKSNVDENDILLVKDTCINDEQRNMDINCLVIDKYNSSNKEVCEPCIIDEPMSENNMADDLIECSSIYLQEKENKSFDQPEIECESLSGTIDDEGIVTVRQPSNSERNNFMSKLCRQGVEKPGGIRSDIENILSIKTYSNNKYRVKCFSPKNNITSDFVCNSSIDLSEEKTLTSIDCQQFCKCYDYGILDYNQLKSSYEHIHFTTKKSLNCKPDIIYDIYNNDIMHIENTGENFDVTEDNRDKMDSEDSEHFICWYNAAHNIFDTEWENSQKQENLIVNDDLIKNRDNSNNSDIDDQGRASTLSDPKHNFEVESYLNPLPEVMNKEAKKSLSKSYSKDSNKLEIQNLSGSNSSKVDCHNQSRKRKISNTNTKDDNNKRVKTLLNHEISAQKSTETQQKHPVVKNSVRSCEVNEETQTAENNQQYVKCGVCSMNVTNAEWLSHNASTHDYIAWKQGEPPVNLEDEEAIRAHLHHTVQELGQLVCTKCGVTRKYAKAFLHHLLRCYTLSDTNDHPEIPYHLSKLFEPPPIKKCHNCDYESNNAKEYAIHLKKCLRKSAHGTRGSIEYKHGEAPTNVTCGVCREEMTSHQWIEHIQREHNYLAWRDGDTPLNVDDEESVRKHLYNIMQDYGPLLCSKCGKSRKYVKLFLQHIESCTGPKEDDNALDTSYVAEWESVLETSLNDNGSENTKMVKCSRCQLEMQSNEWINHIQEHHNYVSWQEGQTPIDICDVEAVRRYLYVVVHKVGSLACSKCGTARRYVKSYLTHVQYCNGPVTDSKANTSVAGNSPEASTDSKIQEVISIKCGVCQKEMNDSSWIAHIAMNHEYIAWKETEPPIDTSSNEAILLHLTNILNEIGFVKCAECGKRCKYAKAYLLHIKNCYGKIYVEIEDGNNTIGNDETVSEIDPFIDDSSVSSVVSEEDGSAVVTCGVCCQQMEARSWLQHSHKEHNYLAWRDGDTPLDFENRDAVRTHLKNIQRHVRRLTCAKCGIRRRKAIPFYNHVKDCDGSSNVLDNSVERSIRIKTETEDMKAIVKCAVCQDEMENRLWIDHIAKQHDYMAWKDGDNPLDMDDEVAVKEHLYRISQLADGLICSKCGKCRKYVKLYQQHIKACNGPEESTSATSNVLEMKIESTNMVTCALCRLEMAESMWMDHISKEHNYVSWKLNTTPLEFKDETALRDYLYNIVQSVGSLKCSKCGLVRKYAKAYILHLELCQRVTWRSINRIIMRLRKEKGDIVRCAVCLLELDDTEWVEHIAAQHNYLAWRDRDKPLNLENEEEVRRHLKNIIGEEGYLKCPKCNLKRKYAKMYLDHVNNCDGTVDGDVEMNNSMNEADLLSGDDLDGLDGSAVIKCGVCAQEVVRAEWITHIQKEHNYLAWEDGRDPIDINDKEAVHRHLTIVSARRGGLACGSCGLVRKSVKAYQHHVRDCSQRNYVRSGETIECGVCSEKMEGKLWRDHAMQVHYNIAWVVGETPIDLRNFFCVDKYLKEYHEYNQKLVCNICGLCRVSLAGFYAHILICGKTDEEIDKWKDECDICHQRYLCIYKKQHYWAHRVQEVAKERKIQEDTKKEKNDESWNENVQPLHGRRRAAEKARSVIGDYAAKFAGLKCKSCTFETDSIEDLAKHRCLKRAMIDDSDDSVSIKLEDYSEEESEETDIESEVFSEEEKAVFVRNKEKKIKNELTGVKGATKCAKFPFDVKDSRPYLKQSKLDHFKLLYTRETLFPTWRDYPYEVVSEEMLPQYMPQLEESCKVSISNGGWTTYKRFESRKENGCKVLFTGGSIQCISWAPEHPDSVPACPSLLAVATHRGPDCPRLLPTDTLSHPALVQIWNFNSFKSIPELAFGMALDYGTVWAMDWCPSGARDLPDNVSSDDNNIWSRLGLLAVACSNGSAYVISVPYLDKSTTSEVTFYKVKPCMELRVSRGNKKYQATSVNWSMFKGYTTIAVGYGDGTVALYDLVSESPLLTAKEGDMNILYPYQDERLHNSSVTGLTSCVLGAWCSSSATGSTAGVAGTGLRAGRGARPLRTHSGLAASVGTFMPHWPNIMLSGDETIVGLSPSELEWGYVGRRVGSVRALAGCPYRARVAAFVPPLLQTLRPHPAAFKGHKTIHKKNVAMLEMTPLAKKRSKHCNDELSMKVEPTSYEDATASYGIKFKFERDFDKAFANRVQQKHRSPYPERFPLGDVVSLAYCPAAAHYTKLALATHAGLLLLFDV